MHCRKILIVEDDDAIRTSLVDLLAFEGYEVVPAHHGKEALRLLSEREEDPCLIITDLTMPEMDGRELIRLMKEKDIIIGIPVVVMSAGPTGDILGKQIIKKPFSLDAVVALVKQHCGPPNGGPILTDQTAL